MPSVFLIEMEMVQLMQRYHIHLSTSSMISIRYIFIIIVVFSYSGTGICDEGYGFVSIRRYSTSIIQTECLTGFSGMEKLNEKYGMRSII